METEQEASRVDAEVPGIQTLRAAIPQSCFQPSLFRSLQYVVRDLLLMLALYYVALKLTRLEPSVLRFVLWTAYGFIQGLIFTGIWILAHECGHHAFSVHKKLNSCIGLFLHSILLVPFFSWKYSHARHHRYANNMEKDTVFVPLRETEYRSSFLTGSFLGHAEDAPLVSIILLLSHQLLGWPIYLLFNASAGMNSLAQFNRKSSSKQSHFDPTSHIFTPSEHPYVLISNCGLLVVFSVIAYFSSFTGVNNMVKIYGLPYLWMNHWLIAITFLHHTHPSAPRYEENSWSYQKGALSTIDRDFGFIGRHIFHGIIEYHMIHHLFPRIPFYHAEEATAAVAPLLGKSYLRTESSFISDIWRTFRSCAYVKESPQDQGHMYWSRANPKIRL